jgi:pimeloyl-ACP methyl ester carboxylesterase
MIHHTIRTNGIQLHVVEDGPASGPLLIFLHGFPECWASWRRQISVLAAAGFRVWVPDQRGYNLSEKPNDISSYSLDQLAADVIGLIDAAGQRRAHLVGHDWGAAVAWWVAAQAPERLERIVVINVPHPRVMLEQVWHNPRQMLRSWYIFFFQIPWLPEALAQLHDSALPVRLMIRSCRPGTFSAHQFDIYRRAWSQPGAWSSMLHWYRAAMRYPPKPLANPRINTPTLMIWGAHDMFLGRELIRPSLEYCVKGKLIVFESATHWVHHEQAARVSELIRKYLTD